MPYLKEENAGTAECCLVWGETSRDCGGKEEAASRSRKSRRRSRVGRGDCNATTGVAGISLIEEQGGWQAQQSCSLGGRRRAPVGVRWCTRGHHALPNGSFEGSRLPLSAPPPPFGPPHRLILVNCQELLERAGGEVRQVGAEQPGGRGDLVVRLLRLTAPGFPRVGILPDCGFSRGSPFNSGVAPFLPYFNLIGFQVLEVNSRANLSIPFHSTPFHYQSYLMLFKITGHRVKVMGPQLHLDLRWQLGDGTTWRPAGAWLLLLNPLSPNANNHTTQGVGIRLCTVANDDDVVGMLLLVVGAAGTVDISKVQEISEELVGLACSGVRSETSLGAKTVSGFTCGLNGNIPAALNPAIAFLGVAACAQASKHGRGRNRYMDAPGVISRNNGKTKPGWSDRGSNPCSLEREPKAASSGTIPICENPGVTRPGIESGSTRWDVSRLTALATVAPRAAQVPRAISTQRTTPLPSRTTPPGAYQSMCTFKCTQVTAVTRFKGWFQKCWNNRGECVCDIAWQQRSPRLPGTWKLSRGLARRGYYRH
ncbi:hypothetical protein PR048_025067 [Dryococelus australis]|uniref:Uncharacterized protein n=1 Tax=Dryococelus australis TaxID=614101 RepID=A0ABQ9GQA7_9NEOP|nr:hypothetical protein PR048_025067 [Dryococelus australis]